MVGRLKWIRGVSLLLLLALLLAPLVVIIQLGVTAPVGRWDDVIYRPFLAATRRSWLLFACLVGAGSLLGTALGTVASLWRFPLKGLSLVLLGFPLVLPPFLIAIGIQSLQPFFPFTVIAWLDGFWGSFWTGLVQVLPLVVFGVMAGAKTVSLAEREFLWLRRGGRFLARRFFFRMLPLAMACAVIGSLLVVADAGPGQIMGYHGISGDILVSFSARSDFQLAAMKALGLLLMFGPFVGLACWVLNRRLNYEALVNRRADQSGIESRWWQSVLLGAVAVLICAVPLMATMAGLVRPLLQPPRESVIEKAWALFTESLGMTISYGLVSGGVALLVGGLIAALVPRSRRMKEILVALSVLLLAIPSCLPALGMVLAGTKALAALDFFFRSHWVVGGTLGLRFVPLAMWLLVIANGQIPRSYGETAILYGVPWWKRLLAIELPQRFGIGLVVFVVVMMLTLADVSSTALLQPPGGASFGSHLFAVMDNSSEKVVASLCLVYLILPVLLMTVLLGLGPLLRNRTKLEQS